MGSFKSTEMDVESIIFNFFSSNEAWVLFGFLSLCLYKYYQNQWLRKKQIKTQRKDFEDHVKANIQANGKRNDDKCLLIESRNWRYSRYKNLRNNVCSEKKIF